MLKQNVDDIKARIENSMPLAIRPSVGSVMNELSQEQTRCHVVVHEAFSNYSNSQLGYIGIQDMKFKVSLIGKDGSISSSSSGVLVSGSCMESILNKAAYLRSVKRFLYDCTAMDLENNRSWMARTR